MGTTENASKLHYRLTSLLRDRNDKSVSVKTSRSILYGKVVKVVDAAKLAGAAPIGLQIAEPEEKK